jgi:hypothetical protein
MIPPIPMPPHILSLNYWNTAAKAEYARFELRAKPQDDNTHDDAAEYSYSDGLNGGPEKYVRLQQDVTIEIGGTEKAVGRVEPIDMKALGHYPFIMPGYEPAPTGTWGLGDYPIEGGYGPAHCTPAFPYVGPDIPAAQLMTGAACIDIFAPGPVGDVLSGALGSPSRAIDQAAKLIFATSEGGKADYPPASEKYQRRARKVCTRDQQEVGGPKAPREGEAECPDILYRDRFD